MSKILNPNLSIDEIKQNYLRTNVLKLSNDYSKNNPNNNFIPTFDFSTDIRLLMNSNATYFTQSNSNNPLGLSKLSIDKFNKIRSNNFDNLNNKERNNNEINNIKEIINNNKDDEKNKINLSDEDNEENKNNKKKYKKINNNNININKKKEIENIKKSEEELEKENINNNLKVSSILNDTIGDNLLNKSKQNSNINENNDLIEFFKKENENLKKSNEKNIQLINSLFCFINQLSFKYSPDKKVFDLSYYYSNITSFSSELNHLYEYINQQKQVIHNNNKNNNIAINSTKINLKKTEDKVCNNRSTLIKDKKDINNNKRRKNNADIINLGRTFTFGQNDSFNKKKSENKINKNKSGNKTKFLKIKEDNQIKKNNSRLNNSRSRSKNKNEIKLLGCNVKGNNSLKNNSKISLENKNFNCIPNEKEAMQSIKNIIYKK